MKKLLIRLLTAEGLALLAAAGFGLVALLVGRNLIAWFDSGIISAVQGMESPGLTAWMRGFSWIGSTLPATMLTVLTGVFLFVFLRHRFELILLVVVMIGSTILNRVLKAVFHRERPDIHLLAEETTFAFPSGHAMASFAFYGIVTYLLWRHIGSRAGRTLLILFCTSMVLVIGISRIYLGVHYPSDIIGGYLASGLCLAAAIGVYQKWAAKRERAGKLTA